VVATALAVDADQFILDGEVLGFFDDDRPHAFQDTISHFSTESSATRSSLVAYFFDCLHVDGTDYLDRRCASAVRYSNASRHHVVSPA
jgi:DNA ligase-1